MSGDHAYPTAEPHSSGMLPVGDGNVVFWQEYGTPAGKPALYVHGGPGSGSGNAWSRSYDPGRYRWIAFDQRGCGRSTPHAADPATDLSVNTTQHLVQDMERLREHLGVERWLLVGGSWGSTLILAYAERYPERVSEIVIAGVTTTRHREIEWLTWEMRRLAPDAFERVHALAPETGCGVDLAAAVSRLLADPDPAVRAHAAAEWCRWEDAAIAHESDGSPGAFSARLDEARLAYVRISTHYFGNGAFLADGVLLREAGRLAGIPGVLVHGRWDLDAPLETAWELAKAWPGAELVVVDAGHTGNAALWRTVGRALERFAAGADEPGAAH